MSKDFNEFKRLLTEDVMLEITEKINTLQLKAEFPLSQENAKQFFTNLGISNLILTLELIEKYHNWMSD